MSQVANVSSATRELTFLFICITFKAASLQQFSKVLRYFFPFRLRGILIDFNLPIFNVIKMSKNKTTIFENKPSSRDLFDSKWVLLKRSKIQKTLLMRSKRTEKNPVLPFDLK